MAPVAAALAWVGGAVGVGTGVAGAGLAGAAAAAAAPTLAGVMVGGAIVGAVVGGVYAGATGKNILKGALVGGLVGVTAGFASATWAGVGATAAPGVGVGTGVGVSEAAPPLAMTIEQAATAGAISTEAGTMLPTGELISVAGTTPAVSAVAPVAKAAAGSEALKYGAITGAMRFGAAALGAEAEAEAKEDMLKQIQAEQEEGRKRRQEGGFGALAPARFAAKEADMFNMSYRKQPQLYDAARPAPEPLVKPKGMLAVPA